MITPQKGIRKIVTKLRSHRIRPVLMKGVAIYLSLTLIFGFLYWVTGGLIFNPARGRVPGIFDSIYFSCITFMTIGYGDIIPNAFAGHLIVFIESWFALLFIPVFGGFLAYKFLQRPNDIVLTENIYLRYRNNSIVLSTRLGNRGKHIIDCNATVEFIQVLNNVKRTLYTVGFSKPIVEFTWYLDIRLDGPNPDALKFFRQMREHPSSSIIRITAVGIDSESGNMVHVFKYYEMNKIVYGSGFADVYHWEGVRRTKPNWNKLNSIDPLSSENRRKIDDLLK